TKVFLHGLDNPNILSPRYVVSACHPEVVTSKSTSLRIVTNSCVITCPSPMPNTPSPGAAAGVDHGYQRRITYCNEAFVAISGYSRDELIGQPHNIVRHPDEPSLAFEVMWTHLKAGPPWMDLVKNRSKDGGDYWVDAYVTPITDHGEVIGYESVRACPSREDVQRAERLYRRINQRGYRACRFRPHGSGCARGVGAAWLGRP
ncbi:PAS domain-containing protein, partial [Guyparkeria halopsychrophila]|uniref:PAS domain-containing protein n=1 Tax=Guyparkeria halopsychrophila TaxID=3139421 RepID=UPI0037C9F455